MKTIKKLWLPVLLGVLLIAALVGVASARPNARPTQQAWRVLAVPARACIGAEGTTDYGWPMPDDKLVCNTPVCFFFCPVDFPAAGEQALGAVKVKRVTMYAFDNDASGWVDFKLIKAYAPIKATAEMAGLGTSDSAADPQTVMDTTIVNNPIYRVQAPYIRLGIPIAPPGAVYGWLIHYTW